VTSQGLRSVYAIPESNEITVLRYSKS
jgi:hypothetical protein